MPAPSGLSSQVGIAEEITFGTIVVPTRFYEVISEKMQLDVKRLESAALRSGTRVIRSDHWIPAEHAAAGEIAMELGMTDSIGVWFKHAMGSVTSIQPDIPGNPTVYKHTFTPGDLPTGLTIQIGKPSVLGVVHPFTYNGCNVDEWTIESSVGEVAKFTVSVLASDETTATALAAASYPATFDLMTFVNGSLTVAGSQFCVRSVKLTGANGLTDDRYCLGSVSRKRAIENKLREYTGSFEAEFEDLVTYNRYVNGTEAAMVLTFIGPTITAGTGTLKKQIVITANVRFDGETPTVNGPDILMLPLNFKCVGASPISIELQNVTATP